MRRADDNQTQKSDRVVCNFQSQIIQDAVHSRSKYNVQGVDITAIHTKITTYIYILVFDTRSWRSGQINACARSREMSARKRSRQRKSCLKCHLNVFVRRALDKYLFFRLQWNLWGANIVWKEDRFSRVRCFQNMHMVKMLPITMVKISKMEKQRTTTAAVSKMEVHFAVFSVFAGSD